MKITQKGLSASEMLHILQKAWLGTSDIRAIAMCGTGRAGQIKKQIADKLEKENYYLPNGLVPTDKVIEYLKINISYLKKISKLEIH